MCRQYRERSGLILHRNVAKVLLWGGEAQSAFRGGRIIKPIEIFIAGRATRRFKASLFCIQDATIAASYAQLAATAQGLASCWVGYFDEAGVATALRAPAGFRPVAIMPIGYAAAAPDWPQRRKLDELVRYDVW